MTTFLHRTMRFLLKRGLRKASFSPFLQLNGVRIFSTTDMAIGCKDIELMDKCTRDTFLSSFDTVLTDCDGVLWVGGEAIKGSPEAITSLRKLGKRVIFVTNNGMSRKDLLTRCHNLGFGGNTEDMITSSYLCAHYLKARNFSKRVYVFGGKGITEELDAAGIENVGLGPDPMPDQWNLRTAEDIVNAMETNIGCVIVGFHYDLSYMKLLKAVTYLQNPEVLFIGTNSDPMAVLHFQNKSCVMPATGSLIAAAQTASGREPIILGKPNRFMFDAVKRVCPNIQPERTLMIGDRADTDIVFGKTAGLITLMVGTGTNTLSDIRQWECSNDDTYNKLVPNYYSNTLIEILQYQNICREIVQ